MPNRFPQLLTLLVGLLVCCCFIAAKAPMVAKQYDYVTIMQAGEELRIASAPNHSTMRYYATRQLRMVSTAISAHS